MLDVDGVKISVACKKAAAMTDVVAPLSLRTVSLMGVSGG